MDAYLLFFFIENIPNYVLFPKSLPIFSVYTIELYAYIRSHVMLSCQVFSKPKTLTKWAMNWKCLFLSLVLFNNRDSVIKWGIKLCLIVHDNKSHQLLHFSQPGSRGKTGIPPSWGEQVELSSPLSLSLCCCASASSTAAAFAACATPSATSPPATARTKPAALPRLPRKPSRALPGASILTGHSLLFLPGSSSPSTGAEPACGWRSIRLWIDFFVYR